MYFLLGSYGHDSRPVKCILKPQSVSGKLIYSPKSHEIWILRIGLITKIWIFFMFTLKLMGRHNRRRRQDYLKKRKACQRLKRRQCNFKAIALLDDHDSESDSHPYLPPFVDTPEEKITSPAASDNFDLESHPHLPPFVDSPEEEKVTSPAASDNSELESHPYLPPFVDSPERKTVTCPTVRDVSELDSYPDLSPFGSIDLPDMTEREVQSTVCNKTDCETYEHDESEEENPMKIVLKDPLYKQFKKYTILKGMLQKVC